MPTPTTFLCFQYLPRDAQACVWKHVLHDAGHNFDPYTTDWVISKWEDRSSLSTGLHFISSRTSLVASFIGGHPHEHESILLTSPFARLVALEWWYDKVKDMPCPPRSLFYRDVREGVIGIFDELIEDMRARLGMKPRPKLTVEEQGGDEKKQDVGVEVHEYEMKEKWNIMTEEELQAEMFIRDYEAQEEREEAFFLESDAGIEDEDDENEQEFEEGDEGEGGSEGLKRA